LMRACSKKRAESGQNPACASCSSEDDAVHRGGRSSARLNPTPCVSADAL
jgi:hypothetical protein